MGWSIRMKGFIFLLLLLIVVVQPSEPERYHVAVPAYAPFRPAEDREDKLDRRRRRRRSRRGGRDPAAPVTAMPPALFVPQEVEMTTEEAVLAMVTEVDTTDFV